MGGAFRNSRLERRLGVSRATSTVLRHVALWVALCLALVSCSLPRHGAADRVGTITFGVTIPITGQLAEEGQYSRDGYVFYVDSINRAGGIDVGGTRYRIALRYYDDQSKPRLIGDLYRKLIVHDKVNFLIGPYSSMLTAAAAPVAEQYGVPMVAPHGSARGIYVAGFKYVFSIVSPAENYLRGIVATSLSQHPRPKSIALLGEYEPFSREAVAGAAEYATARGMTVVDQLYYLPQSNDVSRQLRALKQRNPDILLAAGHLQDAILIVRQARELCLSPRAMGFSVGPSLPGFRANLQSDANYIFGATQWTSDLRYRGDDEWSTPAAYAASFRSAFPGYDQVPYQAAESTAALVAFQHAIESAGSLARHAVRNSLAHLDIMTFYGRVRFDSMGQNTYKPMAVVQLQPDGKTYTVFPFDAATKRVRYPMPALCR